MNFKNIDKFENQNKHLAVNVFGYSKEIYPLRISKKKNTKKINLLYLTKKENTGVKTHFCWIKNLDKLLSMQVSNHKESKVFCERCLNHFPNEEKLKIHMESCEQFDFVKTEMPKEGSICKFKNYQRYMKVPFVVYADFESIVEKVLSVSKSTEKSFTEKYQHHKPCGFCFQIVSPHDNFNPVLYRAKNENENVGEKFFEMLEKEMRKVWEKYKYPKSMIYSEKDREEYNKSNFCWICKEKFGEEKAK